MEDEEEFEVLRLKKLLEESLLKVEKENMELIQSRCFDPTLYSKDTEAFKRRLELESNSGATVNKDRNPNLANIPRKSAHSVVKDVKTCPHVKETNCMRHNGPLNSYGSQHSRIHFINDLQSSLLPISVKKRILQNDGKSKYIPCAVPLSPPIRIKKEDNIPFIDQSQLLQKHAAESKPSETYITHTESSANNAPQNQSGKHYEPQVFPKKKLVIETLPYICIAGEKDSVSPPHPQKLTVEHFPGISVVREKENLPSPNLKRKIAEEKSVEKASSSSSSLLINKDLPMNVSHDFSKERCRSSEDFPRFRSFDRSLLTDKKNTSASPNHIRPNVLPTQEQVPTSSQAEDVSGKDESHGLNFHISLDSLSTKDVINKIMQKIPNFINQTETLDQGSDVYKSNSREQLVKDDNEHQQNFVCKNFSQITKSYQDIERPVHTVSAFVQTDSSIQESVKKSELHTLVKEIVLDTLKETPYLGYNSNRNAASCQKVDSGIQSEIEKDEADLENNVNIQFASKVVPVDNKNVTCQEVIQESKSTQVSFVSIPDVEEKGNFSQDFNRENSDSSEAEENRIQSTIKLSKEGSTHGIEASKVEAMLEKIYEHVCQENKASDTFLNSPVNNPILTRDVAVQFNPLHTSNKSTITLEIKTVDSSSQYDFPKGVKSKQTSTADVSVQAAETSENLDCHKADAYTQCEQKVFVNSVAQTDLLLNYEYSATNTSVSSTPVSDNMFMDDLLSEGEIPLPWNLRLLSLSDKSGSVNMSAADSSDVSIKEKDYSLSEGEIAPNIVNYLNMLHCSHTEENDSHLDVYPSKISTNKCDSEMQLGQSFTHNRNLRLQVTTSSLSEGELNSNTSLSLGEVSPGFRNSFPEMHPKLGSFPSTSSSQNCDKMCCDLNYTLESSSTHPSMTNLNFTRNEDDEKNANVETSFQNAPQLVLSTVDEETHAIFD